MKYNIKEIIEFFDDSNFDNKGDASAVVGIIGEDLNASAFKHYLESNKGCDVEILTCNVTEGHSKGKWLDRWIVDHTNKIMYQCEIKNWSSTAIGGKVLPYNATDEEIKIVSEHHQIKQIKDNFLSTSKFPGPVSKVLLKMRKPEGFEKYKVEPLMAYWMPVSFDKDLLSPFSVLNINKIGIGEKTEFKKLNIFSVSLYLRSLKEDFINLETPNSERRVEQLYRFTQK